MDIGFHFDLMFGIIATVISGVKMAMHVAETGRYKSCPPGQIHLGVDMSTANDRGYEEADEQWPILLDTPGIEDREKERKSRDKDWPGTPEIHYEGFLLEKLDPAAGEKSTWARVGKRNLMMSDVRLVEIIRRRLEQTKRTLLADLMLLSSGQQNIVQRLIEQQNANDRQKDWILADVQLLKKGYWPLRTVKGIQIILKRHYHNIQGDIQGTPHFPDAWKVDNPYATDLSNSGMVKISTSGNISTRTELHSDIVSVTCPEDSWWNDHHKFRWAGKAGVLIFSPLGICILESYAYHHRLIKTDNLILKSHLPFNTVCTLPIEVGQELTLPQQALGPILHPQPLVFFAASTGVGSLMAWYYEVNGPHRYQRHFLLLGLLAWCASSFALDMGLAASIVCVLPWTMYCSLVLSEVAHLLIRNDECDETCE